MMSRSANAIDGKFQAIVLGRDAQMPFLQVLIVGVRPRVCVAGSPANRTRRNGFQGNLIVLSHLPPDSRKTGFLCSPTSEPQDRENSRGPRISQLQLPSRLERNDENLTRVRRGCKLRNQGHACVESKVCLVSVGSKVTGGRTNIRLQTGMRIRLNPPLFCSTRLP